MGNLRSLPPIAALVFLLTGVPCAAEDQPPLRPTRDVDVTYDVTRPQQPKIRERRRWSADENLERVDGPDKSSTIFDANKGEVILLNPKNRTFRKLEGTPRRPNDLKKGAALKRGDEAVIAGLHCIDWSWTDDAETHTVCTTADGVLLRLVIDGSTVLQARSVTYRKQGPELFEVPTNYAPALAPEGGTGL